MGSKHHTHTRCYTLLQVLEERQEDRQRRKHGGEGGQDPSCVRATVTGPSTLCQPGLDKGGSSGGGILGPAASGIKPARPAKVRVREGWGSIVLAHEGRSCQDHGAGRPGRRWGSSSTPDESLMLPPKGMLPIFPTALKGGKLGCRREKLEETLKKLGRGGAAE